SVFRIQIDHVVAINAALSNLRRVQNKLTSGQHDFATGFTMEDEARGRKKGDILVEIEKIKTAAALGEISVVLPFALEAQVHLLSQAPPLTGFLLTHDNLRCKRPMFINCAN